MMMIKKKDEANEMLIHKINREKCMLETSSNMFVDDILNHIQLGLF